MATATFLNPRDEDTGYVLLRRAKRTFNLDADRSFGPVDLGLSFLAQSSRFNDGANTVKLAGYGTLNARVTYHVIKELDLEFKVNNILNRDYVLSQQSGVDYQQDGRNAFVSVIYRPNL